MVEQGSSNNNNNNNLCISRSATRQRPPTEPHMIQDRALTSALQNPAPNRALPGMDEDRHPTHGRRNVNHARIDTRAVEERSAGAAVAPHELHTRNAQPRDSEIWDMIGAVRTLHAMANGHRSEEGALEVPEVERAVLGWLPTVSIDNGPLGSRVDGYVHRFPGETDVTVICFCHRMFFNPAEFFRHAEGTQIPNTHGHMRDERFPPSADGFLPSTEATANVHGDSPSNSNVRASVRPHGREHGNCTRNGDDSE